MCGQCLNSCPLPFSNKGQTDLEPPANAVFDSTDSSGCTKSSLAGWHQHVTSDKLERCWQNQPLWAALVVAHPDHRQVLASAGWHHQPKTVTPGSANLLKHSLWVALPRQLLPQVGASWELLKATWRLLTTPSPICSDTHPSSHTSNTAGCLRLS